MAELAPSGWRPSELSPVSGFACAADSLFCLGFPSSMYGMSSPPKATLSGLPCCLSLCCSPSPASACSSSVLPLPPLPLPTPLDVPFTPWSLWSQLFTSSVRLPSCSTWGARLAAFRLASDASCCTRCFASEASFCVSCFALEASFWVSCFASDAIFCASRFASEAICCADATAWSAARAALAITSLSTSSPALPAPRSPPPPALRVPSASLKRSYTGDASRAGSLPPCCAPPSCSVLEGGVASASCSCGWSFRASATFPGSPSTSCQASSSPTPSPPALPSVPPPLSPLLPLPPRLLSLSPLRLPTKLLRLLRLPVSLPESSSAAACLLPGPPMDCVSAGGLAAACFWAHSCASRLSGEGSSVSSCVSPLLMSP
mmetsp:Transcript_16758/g.50061  ORF Transcript_16758/g.50061 Transcript_16758/m.50061 type:complete len:375 (+) Transcript_16758:1707-2831(+)